MALTTEILNSTNSRGKDRNPSRNSGGGVEEKVGAVRDERRRLPLRNGRRY